MGGGEWGMENGNEAQRHVATQCIAATSYQHPTWPMQHLRLLDICPQQMFSDGTDFVPQHTFLIVTFPKYPITSYMISRRAEHDHLRGAVIKAIKSWLVAV